MNKILSARAKLREPHTDDLRVAVLLALLAMIGPLYIDIMPSIVAALRNGYGLEPAQAGFVAAANGYGSTFGALAALFVVRRIPWRQLAASLLVGLILADITTTAASSYEALVAVRACHGVVGGLLVGLCYALIARTTDPRRAFGILFVFHFGFGGIGVFASTALSSVMADGVVFLVLAAFGVLALPILLWLPPLEPPPEPTGKRSARIRLPTRSLMRIGGLFLFQTANLGLGAFLIGIGTDLGHTAGFSGAAVGFGLWAGVPGALIMLALSRSWGWRPVLPVIVAAGLSKLLIGIGHEPAMFMIAVAMVFLTMAAALPYAFALCAEGDGSGNSAIMAGFASKLGLSTGPAIGGLVYPMGFEPLVAVTVLIVATAAVMFAVSLWPRVVRQHT